MTCLASAGSGGGGEIVLLLLPELPGRRIGSLAFRGLELPNNMPPVDDVVTSLDALALNNLSISIAESIVCVDSLNVWNSEAVVIEAVDFSVYGLIICALPSTVWNGTLESRTTGASASTSLVLSVSG